MANAKTITMEQIYTGNYQVFANGEYVGELTKTDNTAWRALTVYGVSEFDNCANRFDALNRLVGVYHQQIEE